MATKTKKTITITDKIAETLKQDINNGKISAGEAIFERNIAERFHTSVIPVREALRILEGEGFIIHKKFSGYSVRQINPEEMVELYDIIRFLSGQILSKAVPRYTDLTYHRFQTLIEEIDKSKDIDSKILLFKEFVETAFIPAGLKYSLELTMQIFNRNTIIIHEMIEKIFKGTLSTQFMRQFMELCQKKETEMAIKLWMDEYEIRTKNYVAILSNDKF